MNLRWKRYHETTLNPLKCVADMENKTKKRKMLRESLYVGDVNYSREDILAPIP